MKKIRGNIDYKNLWEKVNNQVDEDPVAPAKEQEAPETEEKPVEEEPEPSKDESVSSKITTQSEAIDYSNKIIGLLEEKQKKFNKENNKRVPIAKFKKVFCSAASSSLVGNYDINNWCIANINSFVDSECSEEFSSPNEKDVVFADFECKDYGLVFEFDLSDLFLQYRPEDYYFSPGMI
jgi:hypothetical protein